MRNILCFLLTTVSEILHNTPPRTDQARGNFWESGVNENYFQIALDKKENLLKMLNPVVANDDNKCSLTIDQRTDKREYLVLI